MKVRVNSDELAARVEEEVSSFSADVNRRVNRDSTPAPSASSHCLVPVLSTRIALEFYQKRKRSWLLPEEQVSWEVWAVCLDVVNASTSDELSRLRESTAESLGGVVLDVCQQVNQPQYVPKMPSKTDLGNVFDCRFSDCQPYLFRVSHPILFPEGASSPSSGISTVRKLLKDTLSL